MKWSNELKAWKMVQTHTKSPNTWSLSNKLSSTDIRPSLGQIIEIWGYDNCHRMYRVKQINLVPKRQSRPHFVVGFVKTMLTKSSYFIFCAKRWIEMNRQKSREEKNKQPKTATTTTNIVHIHHTDWTAFTVTTAALLYHLRNHRFRSQSYGFHIHMWIIVVDCARGCTN